ncbi:MAG: cysteine methyltransferase [Chloroflexi bacterium]|nr:cysteine methyltransferase [Chloroflexota bacterium]
MFNPPNAKTFFETVWEIVLQIPPGAVSSYGQIASMIPPDADMEPERMRRLAPRWVGTALRKTPRGKSIPWHRVINSRGEISFPAGSPQADEQRRLLEQEGVEFDRRGRVDLRRFAWAGPDEAFLRRWDLLPPRALG